MGHYGRRLGVRGHRLGRRALGDVATIVTPDTILRWHRQLVARTWTYATGPRRAGVLQEIRRLVVRMADENPTWGDTRIRGALKNVGHRVGRSTFARILRAQGRPPVPERPTSWHTCLRAHWGAIAGADVLTTEVWTWRGLVTYCRLLRYLRFHRGARLMYTLALAPVREAALAASGGLARKRYVE